MVAGALVIPYFYFRETDTLRVSKSELQGLTPTGKGTLEARQERVADFEIPILALAALLTIGGVASVALGGRRLRMAQEKEDAAVDRRAQREDYEIQQLSKDEVDEKRDEQAREVVREDSDGGKGEGKEEDKGGSEAVEAEPERDGAGSSGGEEIAADRRGRAAVESLGKDKAAPRVGWDPKSRGPAQAASGISSGASTRFAETRAEIARIEERAGAIMKAGAGDSYVYLSEVKIVSGRRKVSIDGLFEAKRENRPDVLTEFKVVRLPRSLRGRARIYTDELLALLARYKDVTGRAALGWLVVVLPDNSDEEPTAPLSQIQTEFTDMLLGLGSCTVVEERDLDDLPERFRGTFGA
jgi:hypothetical protein